MLLALAVASADDRLAIADVDEAAGLDAASRSATWVVLIVWVASPRPVPVRLLATAVVL